MRQTYDHRQARIAFERRYSRWDPKTKPRKSFIVHLANHGTDQRTYCGRLRSRTIEVMLLDTDYIPWVHPMDRLCKVCEKNPDWQLFLLARIP